MNPGLDRLFELFEAVPGILKSLANFGYWMFNTEFTLGNLTTTPIEFCFGAGLTLYATYTIIKYFLKITT